MSFYRLTLLVKLFPPTNHKYLCDLLLYEIIYFRVPKWRNYIQLYSSTADLFHRLLFAPEILQDNCPLENAKLQRVNFLRGCTNLNNLPKNRDYFLAWSLVSLDIKPVEIRESPFSSPPQLPAMRFFQNGSQKWLLLVSHEFPGKRGQSDTSLFKASKWGCYSSV